MGNLSMIPQELKARPQWVVWRQEMTKDGKPTKVPYQPRSPQWKASSTKPDTWGSFEQSLNVAKINGFGGVGYVFSPQDDYAGVDFDHCRDSETGQLKYCAQVLIDYLSSYVEISPSGTGIHVLIRGKVPPGGNAKGIPCGGKLEMYSQGRYFTVTGAHLPGTPATIEPRQVELEALHKEIFGQHRPAPPPQTMSHTPELSDLEIIAKARNAQNGDKFDRLMKGNIGEYPSQSEAELAFCSMVVFYTQDPEQLDRLYRASALNRDKWDRPTGGSTYGAKTIEKAIASTTETYQGAIAKPSRGPAAPRSTPTKTEEKQETRGAGFPDYGLTDQGNAYRFKDQWGKDVRWCDQWGKFLYWDERRWTADQVRKVELLAIETVKRMYAEASHIRDKDARKAMADHAKRSEADSKRKAMLSSIKCLLPILPEELDRDPLLLNVLNGTVDLRTGEFRPHSREDFMTKLAPVHFDPKAECPLWWAVLTRILPGKTIEFLQKAMGYSATGWTIEQVFFLLYGGGDNGKTVILETIAGLLGDYAKETDPETFMLKKHSGIPNDLAALRGARFVKSVETSGGRRMSEARIKQMTGCDTLTARFLHAEWFEFRPEFKLWLATNHKPIIRDSTHSMWRRVRFIPFEVQIPKIEQDKRLSEKLRDEYPGILNWIIEGALLWQHEGLEPPESIREATQNYREEMDDLGDFLDECCSLAPGASGTAKELYEAYTGWAGAAGEKKPLSKRGFGLALGERGFRSERGSGVRFWSGIGLRSSDA